MKKLITILFLLACFASYSQTVNVVVMGSSTAAGTGATVYDSSWAGRTQADFRKNTSDGLDTNFINLAVGGTTTNNGIVSGDPLHNITKAVSYGPHLIIINYASNDPANGIPITTSMNNLREMYRVGKESGARVFVSTSQPRNDLTTAQKLNNLHLSDSIKAQFGIYALNFWDAVVTTDGNYNVRPELQADAIQHLNNAGHDSLYRRVIAKELFEPAFIDDYVVKDAIGSQRPSIISLPNDYDDSASKRYPLIIYLHGTGGASNTRNDALLYMEGLPYQIMHGQMPQEKDANGRVYKFIVVAPQHNFFSFGQNFSELKYILADLKTRYRIDTTRTYFTGLSAGAQGTVSAIANEPAFTRQIAGAFAVAFTGYNQSWEADSLHNAGKLWGTHLWGVAGSLDDFGHGFTDGFNRTQDIVNQFNLLSPPVLAIFTSYPGQTHNSIVFDSAYSKYFNQNPVNSTSKNMYQYFLQFQQVSTTPAKIPITANYIFQDNSQRYYDGVASSRPDRLLDGDTTSNFYASNPILQSTHDVTFYLVPFNASVSSVKIWVGTSDACSTQVIVVRKDNNSEVNIGTFTGGTTGQSFTYTNSGTFDVSKVILRTTGGTRFYGSEVAIYGNYTTPPARPKKPKASLGQMAGINNHVWDLMNDAKIAATESLGIRKGAIRTYVSPSQITNVAGDWRFEGELGTDRYSIDSAYGILHRWSPDLFTWLAPVDQYADQLQSWNVIDNFPNKFIKGTVVEYRDFGSWGQVNLNVTQVSNGDDQYYGKWFVYKSGSLVNITETPESFSSSLVGQSRWYNVGGTLGFVPGDVLTFYKSQVSNNPVFFADNPLPNRDTYAAHLRSAQAMFVLASRGGTNPNVPDYPIQGNQRMLKATGHYHLIESINEPNRWWQNFDNHWNGKTLYYEMAMVYDGNKGAFANAGAKQADSNILVTAPGLATDKPDLQFAMADQARINRGYKADGSIDLPFDAIQAHIYSQAENEYGFGNTGGLPPEQGMLPHMRRIVWTIENIFNGTSTAPPETKFIVGEFGWDMHPNSAARAGEYGPYSRGTVNGFWLVRAMLLAAITGIDYMTYFRAFQDWPESQSNNNSGVFGTMALLSQPNDNDATFIVRTMAGNYMAQYNEFADYVPYDTIAMSTGVYCYRYKLPTKDSILIALWSEESTTITNGSPVFTERTGTVDLPITAGNYIVRTFKDDGSTVMDADTSVSTGTVTFNYAAKPIFIQTTLSANTAPTANAGSDQAIQLPTSTVTLTGSGSDPDGSIASVQWTKISGPASGIIVSPNSNTTQITGLTAGTYVFQFSVTDNAGAITTDQVTVVVYAEETSQTVRYRKGSGGVKIKKSF